MLSDAFEFFFFLHMSKKKYPKKIAKYFLFFINFRTVNVSAVHKEMITLQHEHKIDRMSWDFHLKKQEHQNCVV